MRYWRLSPALVLVLGLAACSSANREKAGDEATKAGKEVKAEARDLSKHLDAAVQPDSVSARDKLSSAETTAKREAARVGVNVDSVTLAAKVKAKLASDAGLNTITGVSVDTSGTVVTLSGTVASEDQKKAVQLAASQVAGVTQVRNQLTVQH